MHDRIRTALLLTVGCLLVAPAPLATAQVVHAGGAAPQGGDDVAIGKLTYHEGRYSLLNDDGTVFAHLIPRAAVDIDRYVGQKVTVSGRVSVWSRDHEPRIWVEQVVPSGGEQSGGVRQVAHEEKQKEPLRTAQLPEYVVDPYESPAVTFGPYAPMPVKRCEPPGCFWVNPEYLLWWTDGMQIPPLVTTSPPGTPREDAGVLGEDATQILYGLQDVLTDPRSGFRIRAGGWFDANNRIGLQGDYFWLGEETDEFSASSDAEGAPILARPFFNVNPRDPFTLDPDPPAREDSQLVSYPDVLSGTVSVTSSTRLQSAGIAARVNLAYDSLWANPAASFSRVDLLAGYRFMELSDRLGISEHLVSIDPQVPPVTFDINDHFSTRNEFHGADLGMVWHAGWQRWSLEVLFKTAIGNVHEVVAISGSTTVTEEGFPAEEYEGGLLTQTSNIGRYSRDRFALIPELGLTLRYQVFSQWYLTAGYTLIYFSPVVRAGDQIDLDLNPDQLAPPIEPLEGPLRPEFAFRETNFWAHGLNVGVEGRW